MELLDFLTARLAEDEAWAFAATEDEGYTNWDIPSTGVIQVAGGDLDGLVLAPRGAATHIARHDPARVLAEVKAKRRIVDLWEDPAEIETFPERVHDGRDPDEIETQVAVAETIDHIVRLLASVYADHPDYRPEEWKP